MGRASGVNLSGGETESLARKAARGAGLPWGLAEEAGMAARWLAERGLPGAATLAALLTEIDGAGPLPPVPGETWRAKDDRLCPICCGAALSDRLETGPLVVLDVLHPLLMLPHLASVADRTGRPVTIRWPGGGAILSRTPSLHGALPPARGNVRILPARAPGPWSRAPRTPDPVTPEAFDILNAFAHRTYAPAHLGREGGAGAGLTDSD